MANTDSPAAEPAMMEISEEVISDFEESVQTKTPEKSDQPSGPKKTQEGNNKAKTSEDVGFFKPLRVGEVEIPLVRKAVAPILPEEVLARKIPQFRSQIQKSDRPGCLLESTHFFIETDPYWQQRESELVKIIQLAEETRFESELVASLWRKPFFASSNSRDLSLIPSRDLQSGKVLTPEFSGEQIRIQVLNPENSPYHVSSCQLSFIENETVLIITAENAQEFSRLGMRRNLRREIFYTTLNDGQENRIFPQWLQNGLADVFAGQEAAPSRGNENLQSQFFRLVNSPEDAHGQTAVSVVRYCLTSNDGRIFFPFWAQLAQMYSIGYESLQELGGSRLLADLDAKTRENQNNSQEMLRRFFNKIESNAPYDTFANWQNSLTSISAGEPVRVFWIPEAQVLNAETSDGSLPKIGLDESWKTAFLEMARVLKLAGRSQQGQDVPSFSFPQADPTAGRYVSGVKIQEFGKDPTENSSATPKELPKEDPQTASAEDLRKLESIFVWLKKNPQGAVTLNSDGSILSELFIPGQLDGIFHPGDRTYLLQEYEGNPVLTATFHDDYVLHVIKEKSPQTPGVSEIRILGIEKPEKPGKAGKQK